MQYTDVFTGHWPSGWIYNILVGHDIVNKYISSSSESIPLAEMYFMAQENVCMKLHKHTSSKCKFTKHWFYV